VGVGVGGGGFSTPGWEPFEPLPPPHAVAPARAAARTPAAIHRRHAMSVLPPGRSGLAPAPDAVENLLRVRSPANPRRGCTGGAP
jgi:hypothetical protein